MLLALLLSLQVHAKPADCKLTVNGHTYIKGACEFTPTGGGSFSIQKGDYFAYVNLNDDGTAEGYWNEEPGANHAHSPLGHLTRNDACWTNRRVIVCAE